MNGSVVKKPMEREYGEKNKHVTLARKSVQMMVIQIVIQMVIQIVIQNHRPQFSFQKPKAPGQTPRPHAAGFARPVAQEPGPITKAPGKGPKAEATGPRHQAPGQKQRPQRQHMCPKWSIINGNLACPKIK